MPGDAERWFASPGGAFPASSASKKTELDAPPGPRGAVKSARLGQLLPTPTCNARGEPPTSRCRFPAVFGHEGGPAPWRGRQRGPPSSRRAPRSVLCHPSLGGTCPRLPRAAARPGPTAPIVPPLQHGGAPPADGLERCPNQSDLGGPEVPVARPPNFYLPAIVVRLPRAGDRKAQTPFQGCAPPTAPASSSGGAVPCGIHHPGCPAR